MSLVNLGPTVVPENPFIRLNPNDNVVVARASLPADEVVEFEGVSLNLRQAIGAGHKVAVVDIPKGAVVYKYGVEIGVAGAGPSLRKTSTTAVDSIKSRFADTLGTRSSGPCSMAVTRPVTSTGATSNDWIVMIATG